MIFFSDMKSKKNHFYAKIRPYRNDFIIAPKIEEEEVMSRHFSYLKSLLDNGKLFLAGPTLIESDPFGVIIFETETEEEARKLLMQDPSVKSGIQKIADFRPIRLSLTKK
jgi:uncharacterized protein